MFGVVWFAALGPLWLLRLLHPTIFCTLGSYLLGSCALVLGDSASFLPSCCILSWLLLLATSRCSSDGVFHLDVDLHLPRGFPVKDTSVELG